jgi:hypothetical protein
MAEFNIRTDSVDVEQIMRQIRARIKEKRGVDYTEQQIQELASVKLQRFLDPRGVRSDLVEHFKRTRDPRLEPFQPQQYGFDDKTLYDSHRGIVRFIRALLNPILKLFFNPNPLIQVIQRQTEINALYEKQFYVLRERSQQRDELDALYYELIHNLVLELTRLGIEARNLKMRLESLSSRMDFDERRARALEGVVQYKQGTGPAKEAAVFAKGASAPGSAPDVPPARSFGAGPQARPAYEPRPTSDQAPAAATGSQPATPASGVPAHQTGEGAAAQTSGTAGTARRRRRRRRGRRGGRGRGMGDTANAPHALAAPAEGAAATPPHGDPLGGPASADPGALGAEGSAPHEPQGDFYDSDAARDAEDDSDAGGGSEPSNRDPER